MQYYQKSLQVPLTTIGRVVSMLLLATCLGIPSALADESRSDGGGKNLIELKGHTGRIPYFSFSPDGQFLATASFDKSARLWDLKTGKTIRTFAGINSAVICAVFSPDGERLATSGGFTDPSIHVWDIANGEELTVLRGHTSGVSALAFSADGKRMASGSVNNVLKVWNLETGKEIWTIDEHSDEVCSVAFSPDGKYFASGSHDDTACLWDNGTGKKLRTFNGRANVLHFLRGGEDIAIASQDGKVFAWDIETGTEKQELVDHGDRGILQFLEDPKGDFRSIDGGGKVKLWSGGRCTGTIALPWRQDVSVSDAEAFSTDGSIVAWSGIDSMSVTLWKIVP